MDLSLFLAKLFGTYFIIMGLIVLARKSTMRELINGLKANHILMILIALIEIIAGLALAITHSVFTPDYRVIITVVGYWLIIEGIIYITLSKKSLKKFLNTFNNNGWYVGGSIISIILGAYLMVKGFGWWM